MQTQHFRDESIIPMATGFYECSYIERYRQEYRTLPPTMDCFDLNYPERQMHKRPRSPPPVPSRRSRSRSRSLKRRNRSSPTAHYHDYRSYDHRHNNDPYDDRHSSHSRAQQVRPQESRCIGVFGLSGRTTETDIRRIFSKYGYIENVTLIMDNRTRRSRGYCFVYFDSLKSAIRAVESSANLRIDSRNVRVDYSLTARPRSVDRYKDEIKGGYGSDYSRHRSHRSGRGSSPSPRRHHR